MVIAELNLLLFSVCFSTFPAMVHIYTFTANVKEKVQHFWKYAHSLSCQHLDEEIDTTLRHGNSQVIIWRLVPLEVKEVRKVFFRC